MTLTWDRRYDKWEDLRQSYARCERCMKDAPYAWCCKHHCGSWDYCKDCDAECREGIKLCVK
jgi:hypothetical protein